MCNCASSPTSTCAMPTIGQQQHLGENNMASNAILRSVRCSWSSSPPIAIKSEQPRFPQSQGIWRRVWVDSWKNLDWKLSFPSLWRSSTSSPCRKSHANTILEKGCEVAGVDGKPHAHAHEDPHPCQHPRLHEDDCHPCEENRFHLHHQSQALWCFNHSPVTQFSVKPQGRPATVELVEVLVDRVNQPLIQPSNTSGWKNKSGWVNQQHRQHPRE